MLTLTVQALTAPNVVSALLINAQVFLTGWHGTIEHSHIPFILHSSMNFPIENTMFCRSKSEIKSVGREEANRITKCTICIVQTQFQSLLFKLLLLFSVRQFNHKYNP